MTSTANRGEDEVLAAAKELIARRGPAAIDAATSRVAELERQDRWPEHALALRVLNAVERLLDAGRT